MKEPLSVDAQLRILQNLSEEQVALLPLHMQEMLYRQRQAEATGAVGGYFQEPSGPAGLRPQMPAGQGVAQPYGYGSNMGPAGTGMPEEQFHTIFGFRRPTLIKKR